MSLKLKLISLISAFTLVLGMLLFGVFAATNVTIQMGGSLSFIATDVYAKVTGAITGAGVGNQTLPTIEFSASNENPDQSGWQNLDIEFNTAGDPITIEVTVENLASDRNLTVNLQDNFSSQQGVLVKEVRNGSSTYTGADVVLNASTGAETSTTTFAITLSLSSKNNSLPDTEFGYTINLYDASYVPPLEEITGFSFSTSDDGTATLLSYTGTDTNVVVPDSFSIATIDTGVAGYTKTFNNMDEFTAYMNNQYNQIILMTGFYYMTTPLTERTFVTNYENYFAELYTLAGNDPTKLFPMTIQTTDYEMTYENFTSLGEVGQRGIIKPLYDVMFGNVGGATIEFNSGEKYDISSANAEDIGNEIMSSSLSENSFPIKVSYPTEKTMYVEGDDYVVTSIGDVFRHNGDLTSITLPSSLTSIGSYAFEDCSGLTSIDLSGCTSVTSIGASAFYNCSRLTSITLPSSLTSVGERAFYYCSGLETITVEAGNTVYHSEGNCLIETASGTLIAGCKNSVIPQNGSVTSIGSSAFSGRSGLTSIIIPSSLTTIGHSAFSGCSSLTSVTFGENSQLTTIGSYAFEDCSGPISIDLSNCTSLTVIGERAFSRCSGLTSIILPGSLTTIGGRAFDGCSGPISIDLSNCTSLTTIGVSAFSGCSGLTNITIPDSVSTIGTWAFSGCSGLTSVTFEENSQLTTIGSYAFDGCSGPISIDLSNCTSLTVIGGRAFDGCSGLTSITIPEGVTTISSYAFSGCRSLTSVTFGENSQLTTIGSYAFEDCSGLTGELVIPAGVTSIGSYAFYNCSNLATVYIDSETIANGITNSSSYGFLTDNATTLYIKDTITVTTVPYRFTVDPSGSDVDGYVKYIRA